MNPHERALLASNIFHAAHSLIGKLAPSLWHRGRNREIDTYKLNSSQALAIDVFGTIKESSDCNIIMDSIAQDLCLPVGGSWKVCLEWLDSVNRLNEQRKTQVDAMAENHNTVIFFECKFTEEDGGSCSQPEKIRSGANKGLIQCDGNYHLQVNPINQIEKQCALTGKGIRYWDVIPEISMYDNNQDYIPCPFRGPEYQWMRNLVVCWQYAKEMNKQPAFVVVYADRADLPMAKKAATWNKLQQEIKLKPNTILFERRSYQHIVQLAINAAQTNQGLFRELDKWIKDKILKV